MKKIATIIILFCFLFTLQGCRQEAKGATSNEAATDNNELKILSEKLAIQMAKGKFDDTYKVCSLTIKLKMTKISLQQAWNKTVGGMGKYIGVHEVTQQEVNNSQIVNVVLQYEYNGLKISFTYNKDGKIDGLWLNYSPIEEDPVSTDLYKEIKISFGKGKYPVTGILTLPKKVKNPPVAILVPGSGNHDANETVGANKPFRDIAWGLAEQGIASIRYSERVFLYPEIVKSNFTIEMDSLNDAADAINYAYKSKQVDHGNIFVIGHSLGGMMAPKIAYDHPEVAGIVLLAGSPRRLEDIIFDQVMDALENTKGITAAQTKVSITTTKNAMNTIQKLTEGSSKLILGYPETYWYSLNQIDIADISTELKIPIFVAQGSDDFQVYADKDYTMWQELLGDKKNVTFELYDNLNHLFMTSNGKTDVTEYNTAGSVEQTVLDDIVSWIKSN